MRIILLAKEIRKNPKRLLEIALNRSCNILPQWIYLSIKFKMKMGKWPNIRHPKTFNEKLQWLKIHDHNPQYTQMVDKFAAKKWAANIIGSEYIVETLGCWNTPDEINWNLLPQKFVLKISHGGGGNGVIICRDKDNIDKKKVRNSLKSAMSLNLYKYNKEWPYKNVIPKIIAERLLFDNNRPDEVVNDYKFYCFNGKMEFMLISNDRNNKHAKFDYFDRNFNHLPFRQGGENYDGIIIRPKNFELMIYLAEKLSKGIPHVRVDFYDVNGHVYFGEMTFFDSSGFAAFEPEEWDYKYGDLIVLPKTGK